VGAKYYFSTRDLLVIAILASLGGVLSAYVGYLGNMVNHLVGVPYGAGQIMGGLHILWMVLILAITGKKGSGALAGLLKGFVEFISGSHLGIFVVLLSLAEGIFTEIGYWPFQKHRKLAYIIAGGLGSFANVLVFQVVYQVYDNVFLFAAVSLLALISGLVFAGFFAGGVMDNLEDAGIVRKEKKPEKILSFSLPKAFALLLALAIAFSAIYYFALVQLKGDPMEFHVTGDVPYTKDYYLPNYQSYYVTINAKLDGQVTHLPAQDYTGLPVSYVLKDARMGDDARSIDVVGSDGYYQIFNVSEIVDNDDLILTQDNGTIKLVARGYPGQLWVSFVKEIRVY
jgi:energy-coupling factor transport system substrate-specific component